MDQNKNQGQRPGEQKSGQQNTQQNQPQTQNPNREPAEGPRHQEMPEKQGSQHDQTRGRGFQGERNRSDESSRGEGISNRGMGRELDEQSELPDRGSSQRDRDRESER
jgi:hypothetical protein